MKAIVSLTLLAGLAASAISLQVQSSAAATLNPQHCAALAELRIDASKIGLPTSGGKITAAEYRAADGAVPAVNGDYCLVSGAIMPIDQNAPNILFQVGLPAAWNSRTLMLGGGGFNGIIPDITMNFMNLAPDALTPLGRGYAVFASDSGHVNPATEPGAFMLNQEAHLNWMGNALKKTRDASMALLDAAYGKAPSQAYFIGGSTGGREALMVAGRWPADWNGIVSMFPARAVTTQVLGAVLVNRALAAPGAFLNPAERAVLYRTVLAACDGKDGLRDGVISDVRGCNASFNPAVATFDGRPLRCPEGLDAGDHCLSDAQLAAVAAINGSGNFDYLASGDVTFPGYNVYTSDTGMANTTPLTPMLSFMGFGATPPTFPTSPGASLSVAFADNYLRYGLDKLDFNPLEFDPENPGAYASRLSELSELDAADHDLTAFASRGGKLLLMHGTADMIVSPRYSQLYYQQLQTTMGEQNVAAFLRYFEVPGFSHGISNDFMASWDLLTALNDWVVEGVDPAANQVVMDVAAVPGRTRPLCQFPSWPKYAGSGDVNSAASFTCAAE